MTIAERIAAFQALGNDLQNLSVQDRKRLSAEAVRENGWFTEGSIELAFSGLAILLEPKALAKWAGSYPAEKVVSKSIGVASAGNIPLVGFHDFLCILMAGHVLHYKPSTRDTVLPDFVLGKLSSIESRFEHRIKRTERLNGVDAIIATGSDNSSRYFEYYFRKVPHIIRKNRVSCGVIQGDELETEIEALGKDVFSYYGLGCRNVATVLVPKDYELERLASSLSGFSDVLDNHKYVNNYTYQKTLLMLNKEQFLDNGVLLIRESDSLLSPIAVLHCIRYVDQPDLKAKLSKHREKIQVIVSAKGWFEGSIPFGTAQFPSVDDYADGVDTMRFLTTLK